jgi:hypothetical protein
VNLGDWSQDRKSFRLAEFADAWRDAGSSINNSRLVRKTNSRVKTHFHHGLQKGLIYNYISLCIV